MPTRLKIVEWNLEKSHFNFTKLNIYLDGIIVVKYEKIIHKMPLKEYYRRY